MASYLNETSESNGSHKPTCAPSGHLFHSIKASSGLWLLAEHSDAVASIGLPPTHPSRLGCGTSRSWMLHSRILAQERAGNARRDPAAGLWGIWIDSCPCFLHLPTLIVFALNASMCIWAFIVLASALCIPSQHAEQKKNRFCAPP